MRKLFSIVVAAFAATTPLFSIAQVQKASEILFGYCHEISRGLGSATPGTIESAAIEIPQDLSQKWAGNFVSQIEVGFGSSSESEITVFIASSLDSEPLLTQKATIEHQLGWNSIVLDTPYEITGEPFFVGYGSLVSQAGDRPIGIDDVKNQNPYSSWIEIDGSWDNYAQFFGNVCLKILVEGEKLPQNEVVLNSVDAPALVEAGTPFSVSLNVTNLGAASIASVSPAYNISDETFEVMEVSFPDGEIPSQQSGTIVLSCLVCEKTGFAIPMMIDLGLINGEANESESENTATVKLDCAEKCYAQAVVVEEFTGTWCGWCPSGIVGMQYMEENYGDRGFIGIAIHYADQMGVESYAPLAARYYNNPGFPSAIVNRGEAFLPSAESLEAHYIATSSQLAPATVKVDALYDAENKTLTATAESEYSFDLTDSSYRIAFVITENNLGPYLQDNFYSGGQLGEILEGWSDKPATVLTFFDEVARDITDLYGIDESLPDNITAQEKYVYSRDLPLDNVSVIDNCTVIALIVDAKTGKIVNGGKTEIEYAAGVNGIDANKNDLLKVYNLQGVKVLETKDASQLNTLSRGIYIINGKKVII